MQTLTEIVAAVVVSSSAAAYSHFGVTLDTQQVDKPAPAQRTVARTVTRKVAAAPNARMVVKVAKPAGEERPLCPDERARLRV
jgi:hypothetical protein